MARAVGIDLGTTNSVVAFLDGGRPETISNNEGSKTTPSVVLYKPSTDEVIVGELAKRQSVVLPGHVIRSIKRVMGKRFQELGPEAAQLPYKVVELEDGFTGVELGDGTRIRPEDVSADILDKMRGIAEDFLGEDVTEAVITVPAHFNDQQRTATKVAAELIGLHVQRIINEPTAAALAYGIGQNKSGNIAVFDFGGGTFDVSILHISSDIFEVLSTNGDNYLGGDDIDTRLMQDMCEKIKEQTSIDPAGDRQALQRIREASEKAKCELSTLTSTHISLPFIVADNTGPKHFEMELTRDRFNEMMEPIYKRLLEPCKRALADANKSPQEISECLLVGGSTRIPKVQELVKKFFGKEPNRSINPDEAVALGASVQSAVISGEIREVLLLDVTPLTLGLELAGGVFKELITRNSTIPCEASRKFTTVVDNQSSVVVHVLQGERRKAAENHSLAKFRLVGIPPAPKELPEIEVKFSIDANGILSVSALDLATGQRTGIVVENYGEIGSRRDEIDRRLKDAERNVEEDRRFLQFAEKRAKAERLQLRANKMIELIGDELQERDIKTLKESMLKLDLAMEAMDEARMVELEEIIEGLLSHYNESLEVHKMLNSEFEQLAIPPSSAGGVRQGGQTTAPSTSSPEPPATEQPADMPMPPGKPGGAGKRANISEDPTPRNLDDISGLDDEPSSPFNNMETTESTAPGEDPSVSARQGKAFQKPPKPTGAKVESDFDIRFAPPPPPPPK